MPSEARSRSERNAGKRWSTLDKRDLTDALARGDSIAYAATFLLRPIDEVARKAAELGLLTKSWGKYTIDLYYDDADGGGIEQELAREDRLDVSHGRCMNSCARNIRGAKCYCAKVPRRSGVAPTNKAPPMRASALLVHRAGLLKITHACRRHKREEPRVTRMTRGSLTEHKSESQVPRGVSGGLSARASVARFAPFGPDCKPL